MGNSGCVRGIGGTRCDALLSIAPLSEKAETAHKLFGIEASKGDGFRDSATVWPLRDDWGAGGVGNGMLRLSWR